MAYPAGVQTVTLRLGSTFDSAGTLASITGYVVPMMGAGADHLVWGATGQTYAKVRTNLAWDDTEKVALATVPHPTQAGWRDQTQASFAGWSYQISAVAVYASGERQSFERIVTPQPGDAVIDVDLLPNGAAATPTIVAGWELARADAIAALAASEVEQVTLTGNLAYTLPASVMPNRVHSVVFTQDATGGHTVTYGGAALTVDTTAGAQTEVELWPNGTATRTVVYPGAAALGGSSTITADDTPAAPAEGESASYLVTSAVSWPAGLVWSTDPDGGVAPTITGTALVSMFTVGGTTRAILGATFPGVVVPDTTAPSTVTGLTATATGPTTVDLAWSPATDNVGVTGYEYRIGGGAVVDAGTGTTETVTGLTAGTPYSFEVRAYDAAGNRSAAWSTVAAATTTAPDTTPPVWTATLTPGTPTTTSVVVTASALATDANAITYERTLDSTAGTPAWAAIVPSGLNFTLDNLTAGTVYDNCALRAKDAAGNPSTVLAVPSFTTKASATPLPVTAGLVGHWDPSDAATRTMTGAALTQLADKSGGSRHLVKHTQNAPTLGALNGLTAMSFAEARLMNTSGFPMSGTGDSYTLAFVATPSSVASAYLLEFGITGSTRDAVISNYGGKSFERYADGSSTTRYDIQASATGHHVITITRSGSTWSSTLDGVAAGSGSGALAAIAAPSLWVGGSHILTADHATTTIGEMVLYDTALSAGDLDLVEDYLKTKWGVA